MATQFLLVTFPERRTVLVDDAEVGDTNTRLQLPGDQYTVTLEGDGYTPASQRIALTGTSINKPLVVKFLPAVVLTGAPAGALAPQRSAARLPAGTKAKTKKKLTTKAKRSRVAKSVIGARKKRAARQGALTPKKPSQRVKNHG